MPSAGYVPESKRCVLASGTATSVDDQQPGNAVAGPVLTPACSTIWYALEDRLPEGDRPVLLFPCITDVGIPFITSNPEYVRRFAQQWGFTHWADIGELPDGLEAAARARCEEARQADARRAPRSHTHYWRDLRCTLSMRQGAARRRGLTRKIPLACR